MVFRDARNRKPTVTMFNGSQLLGDLVQCFLPRYLFPFALPALSYSAHGMQRPVGMIPRCYRAIHPFDAESSARARMRRVARNLDNLVVYDVNQRTTSNSALCARTWNYLSFHMQHPFDSNHARIAATSNYNASVLPLAQLFH